MITSPRARFFLNPNKRGEDGAKRFGEEALRSAKPMGVIFADYTPYEVLLYLKEVDRMLERAKAVTQYERWTAVEYARFADDCAPRAQRAEEGPMCVTA